MSVVYPDLCGACDFHFVAVHALRHAIEGGDQTARAVLEQLPPPKSGPVLRDHPIRALLRPYLQQYLQVVKQRLVDADDAGEEDYAAELGEICMVIPVFL